MCDNANYLTMESPNNESEANVVQLFFMTITLKEQLDTSNSNIPIVIASEFYSKLRDIIGAIDKSLLSLLPELDKENTNLEDLNFAVKIAYSIVLPLIIKYHKVFENVLDIAGKLENNKNDFLSAHHDLMFALGLNEDWASSALYLSMLEISINKKLIESGEKENTIKELTFNKRIDKVNELGKNKGIELQALLADSFYRARNKVLHEGKKPTSEEAKMISQFVKQFYSDLAQI